MIPSPMLPVIALTSSAKRTGRAGVQRWVAILPASITVLRSLHSCLRYSAWLVLGHVCATEGIKERGLAMVDVSQPETKTNKQ